MSEEKCVFCASKSLTVTTWVCGTHEIRYAQCDDCLGVSVSTKKIEQPVDEEEPS
jgi:hypothetical protein